MCDRKETTTNKMIALLEVFKFFIVSCNESFDPRLNITLHILEHRNKLLIDTNARNASFRILQCFCSDGIQLLFHVSS